MRNVNITPYKNANIPTDTFIQKNPSSPHHRYQLIIKFEK
jgi:hypothetical protein